MGNVNNWEISSSDIFAQGPVVPVVVINDINDALPIAEALLEGGVNLVEITLRTTCAIDAIELIGKKLPQAMVGAGTVINKDQLKKIENVGAKFAISPGLSSDLLKAANNGNIALIPGISTSSELMMGLDFGFTHFKFFPAEANGGIKSLKAISGPFPQVTFCPTGGISLKNYKDYLSLANVPCVGGSWLVPKDAIANKEWSKITSLAKEALK